ncbi:MAG: multiheme c-type cytochrome [Myxococcota bacterium]|nr:multiheme c-type cytochrome [Myxococcota bacterium]
MVGFITWVWLAGILLSSGPASAADRPANQVPRLLILSSMIGYVEPCGCTIDLLLGGLARIASVIEEERRHGPTEVLLVGPHLFEKKAPAHRIAQEKAKARLLARAFSHLKVNAGLGSENELFYGLDAYQDLTQGWKFDDVAVNRAGGRGRLIQLGAHTIGIIGIGGPGKKTPRGHLKPIDDKTLEKIANTLRQDGAQAIVALSTLSRLELRRLARRVKGIDLWILGDHPQENDTVSPAGDSFIIEAGDRGRNVGRIRLYHLDKAGPLVDPIGHFKREQKRLNTRRTYLTDMYKRTKSPFLKTQLDQVQTQINTLKAPTGQGKRFDYTLIPVKKDIKRHAPIAGWVDTYNASLKKLNLASAGEIKPVKPGESGYVGDAECADCHPDAKAFWDRTKHAKAWQTLVDADKTFDAECVECHVTGWQRPGGSILGQVNHLTNVQCEVCHGPGSRHVEGGGAIAGDNPGEAALIKRTVPQALCETCHNQHHSPKFDYKTYMRKITGPGHPLRSEL